MNKIELEKQFNPSYAVDLFRGEETVGKWWEQRRKLPRNIRYGLLDQKTEELIRELGNKYKLHGEEKIGSVSVLIRNYLSGLLKEDQLKKEVYQRFQLNDTLSPKFLDDFKILVERVKQIGIESVKKDLVASKFSEMLEKFPNVKDQEIGIYGIIFPDESNENFPTIENWITDYKLRKNNEQKDPALSVGGYLFNSPNTQNLNLEEKEQLSLVLSSYEKNSTVYYNSLFEQLDFEIIKLLEKSKKSKNKPNVNITSFESKPYHDTDKSEAKSVPKEDEKPEPQAVEKKQESSPVNPDSPKVLDLNNYV